MSSAVRVRIAPSPTGAFTVGNARTALFNYLFARRHGGAFVLRVEDTDQTRSTQESLETVLSGLRWLGLEWDEGPEVGGDHGPYFQSQRLPLYQAQARIALESGQAYECFCTPDELKTRREERRKAKQDPKYDGRCRDLTPEQRRQLRADGRPGAVRFLAPQTGATSWNDLVRGNVSFENELLDDFVIQRSDGFPTYNFAVVVDDALMEISHVIRGEDGISNTPRQLLLYRALDFEPPVFGHVPLLLGKDRSKLSKRHGATSLAEFQSRGILPDAMFNYLALLGWSPGGGEDEEEVYSREELTRRFDLGAVGKSGAVFDHEKLGWMNGHYLRAMPADRLEAAAIPFLAEVGLVQAPPTDEQQRLLRTVLPLVQERLKRLSELPDAVGYVFDADFTYDPKAEKKWLRKPETAEVLRNLVCSLEALPEFTEEALETAVRELAETRELSAAKVIHPTRVAVTGRTFGPGLFELMIVLGQEECRRRIRRTLDHMHSLQ